MRHLCSTNFSKGVSLAGRIRCKLTYKECLSSAMICVSHLEIGAKNVTAALHYKIGSVDQSTHRLFQPRESFSKENKTILTSFKSVSVVIVLSYFPI